MLVSFFALHSATSRTQPRWPSGKASASRAADLGSIATVCHQSFSRVSHYSALEKIGTPVATLPGASLYRVNTGTGWL